MELLALSEGVNRSPEPIGKMLAVGGWSRQNLDPGE